MAKIADMGQRNCSKVNERFTNIMAQQANDNTLLQINYKPLQENAKTFRQANDKTLQETDKTLQKTDKTLQKTDKTLQKNNKTLRQKTVNLRIIQTSDVHGSFFPYDFITRKPIGGSLARVKTYADSLRSTYGDRLLLLDNGDILQGQPTCYYCNFVKPDMPNVAAKVVNYMRYDAECVGNHDVETGHKVYDKWIRELNCPVIGANILKNEANSPDIGTNILKNNAESREPYVSPYALYERDGVKIAILGMLTPAIPNWLNEDLWSGIHFEEMVSSAKYWIEYIKKNEKPDVIIGLFHSGKDGGIHTDEYDEDASEKVAREVPGFDLILFGHDHTMHNDIVEDTEGHKVVCLDPSSNANYVCDAEIKVTMNIAEDGRLSLARRPEVTGKLVSMDGIAVDEEMVNYFKDDIDSVKTFVDRKIGVFKKTLYTRDCYFGDAAFSDLIHDLQLKLTGADISFNAPLNFNSVVSEGDIRVADLFTLYKYENQVYALKMTGEEIRKHLEMSYDLWVNTMRSADDHIMLIDERAATDRQRFGFKNLAFNFDSAQGIDYEVDVTKPNGQKVSILRMSNGEPFDEHKTYLVAMNSYRGNGGGELLTRGAGIPAKELPSRIVFKTEKDQRYYLMQLIEKQGVLDPRCDNNWKFVPERWTKKAIERDKKLLFK